MAAESSARRVLCRAVNGSDMAGASSLAMSTPRLTATPRVPYPDPGSAMPVSSRPFLVTGQKTTTSSTWLHSTCCSRQCRDRQPSRRLAERSSVPPGGAKPDANYSDRMRKSLDRFNLRFDRVKRLLLAHHQ